MRVAAIDVGTNSTRLLVAEEQPDGFRSVERRMVITRLGQGVDRLRLLDPEALQRTLLTIADYAAICGELGVERLRVTGTSAVRDARNRAEFFRGVERLTGSEPELLSGEAEARATFLGALSDLDASRPVLVVDIGGGSTELVYGTGSAGPEDATGTGSAGPEDATGTGSAGPEDATGTGSAGPAKGQGPARSISLDIGCVRMFEKYLLSDPPSPTELGALRVAARGPLSEAHEALEVPPGTRLVGVAGTLTQLAALQAGVPVHDTDVTHHAVLTHGDVRLLAKRLETLPYDKRKQVKGLEPGRVDVIVAGAEILLAVMEVFDAGEVLVSEKDILDGLVLELLEWQAARDN